MNDFVLHKSPRFSYINVSFIFIVLSLSEIEVTRSVVSIEVTSPNNVQFWQQILFVVLVLLSEQAVIFFFIFFHWIIFLRPMRYIFWRVQTDL